MRPFVKHLLVVLGAFLVAYIIFNPIIKNLFAEKDTFEITTKTQQEFIIATGNIEARNDVLLSFKNSGVVSALNFSAGEEVAVEEVIVSLQSDDIQSEIVEQKFQIKKERAKLEKFTKGPDLLGRSRILASKSLSKQNLDNELYTSFATMKYNSSKIENQVRTQIDQLFSGPLTRPRFEGNVPVVDKQVLGRIRAELEGIFSKWNKVALPKKELEIVTAIENFYVDLVLIEKRVTEIYSTILPFRKTNEENEQAFVSVANLRDSMLSTILETTKNIGSIKKFKAQYELNAAESAELLVGGSTQDKKAQNAQLDVELERLKKLELKLEDTKIKAPFDGVVGEVFVENGEFVSQGLEAVRFISKGGFNISVDITEVEIQKIGIGDRMKAVIQSTDEEVGVVVRTIDATERRVSDVPVYNVVFDVVDNDFELRPGLTVDVYIPVSEEKEFSVVPEYAIQKGNEESFIYVLRGGDMFMVPVEIGEIIEGELISIEGNFQIGDVVSFVKPKR